MSALRVCFVMHQSAKEGAGRYMLDQVDQLLAQGIEVCAVLPGDGPMHLALAQRDVPVRMVPQPWWTTHHVAAGGPPYGRTLRAAQRIASALGEWKVDVVYTHTVVVHAGAIGAAIAELPHIWHIHEFAYNPTGLMMGVPKPQLARLIAQTSNRVYFASQAISNDWTAELANLQTRVVFNWTEVNKRQDAPEISDSVAVGYLNDPGVFVIAIIGSLVEWKRQADAVEAVGNLLRDGLNVALLVVGPEVDANYAGRLRQLAALQVHPERIRFCGYTESPEPVMREADLCLVCSDKEPFGRVTIESMAQGTPVVGTNSGGTPEIIRDGVNGLLYPTGDVNALTQCLRLLATNPVRHAELAAGARDDRRFTNPGRAMAPVISELIELRGQSNPASAVAAFFNRGLNEIQLESRATNSLDQRAKRFVKMLLGRR